MLNTTEDEKQRRNNTATNKNADNAVTNNHAESTVGNKDVDSVTSNTASVINGNNSSSFENQTVAPNNSSKMEVGKESPALLNSTAADAGVSLSMIDGKSTGKEKVNKD